MSRKESMSLSIIVNNNVLHSNISNNNHAKFTATYIKYEFNLVRSV